MSTAHPHGGLPGREPASSRPDSSESASSPGAAPAAQTRVTLITKPGCHLCTLARQVIVRVADELDVGWEERSILDIEDPDPMWWEQLPITLVDGRQHDYWRVSESRLRSALTDTPKLTSA